MAMSVMVLTLLSTIIQIYRGGQINWLRKPEYDYVFFFVFVFHIWLKKRIMVYNVDGKKSYLFDE